MTVVDGQKVPVGENSDNTIDSYQGNIEAAYEYSPSTTKELSVWIGVIRKSFEPNYTDRTSGEGNPLGTRLYVMYGWPIVGARVRR